MKLTSSTKGVIFAILSGIFFGGIGYFGMTSQTKNFSLYDMLFWRFLLASILLVPFLFSKKQWQNLTPLDVFKGLMLGCFAGGASSLFYFYSATELGTGVAMVAFYIFPAFVVLLSWYFDKKPPNTQTFLTMGLMLIGIILLADINCDHWSMTGIFWAITAAIFYAVYVFWYGRSTLPAILSTFISCLGITGFCLISKVIVYGYWHIAMPENWILILCLTLISTVLPILFLFMSMKLIDSTKASMLSIFEPVTILLVGWWLLQEHINLQQLLGVAIVLIGAILIKKQTAHENVT